jgi:hypothetical protein
MNKLKHILLVAGLSLVTLEGFTQPCSREELQKKPGVWKEGMKGSTNNVTAANLAKEKEVVQSIFAMIKEGYSPIGCEVTHTGVYGYNDAEGRNWVSDPYKFMAYFLRYLCDPNDKQKSYVEIATPTILSISVNHFTYSVPVIFAADLPDDHKEGYIMVRELPEFKDGYYYWESKTEYNPRSNYNSKDKRYYWLIAHNNKLPYAHVTQKEYLLKTLASFKSSVQEINENEARSKANILGFSEDDKRMYDQQRDYYSPAIQKIEGMLKNKSESELASPAVILHPGDMQPYSDLVKMGTPGADILIKPNPDYYDKKLPKHAPQLFSINLTVGHGDPVFEHVYENVSNAINIQKLKAMLGESPTPKAASSPAPQAASSPGPQAASSPAPIAPAIVMTQETASAFDVYKNEPTTGFVQTPVSQIKNVVKIAPVDPKIKIAAMNLRIDEINKTAELNRLLKDIQALLSPAQLAQCNEYLRLSSVEAYELADLGVMLYYKGMAKESLWFIAKAATMEPQSDYILNNLSGILNMAGGAPRSLPFLRYLAGKHPSNTTVLNNLAQAWVELGEFVKGKEMLDNCLQLNPYHPQANFTRAVVAEKEGKNQEAVKYIEESLKASYNPETENYARAKGVKLDHGRLINRKRPVDVDHINVYKYREPPQCKSVQESEEREEQWKTWSNAIQAIQTQIEGGMEGSQANYYKKMEAFQKNPNRMPGIPTGIFAKKAAVLYQFYLDKSGEIGRDAEEFLNIKYNKEKAALELQLEKAFERISKTYSNKSGEGKGYFGDAECAERNAANNAYLAGIAQINDDFNSRFSNPFRAVQLELMYWSQFLPEPAELREMKYYQHAMFAISSPHLKYAEFKYPCAENPVTTGKSTEVEKFEPYCPISFKFKFKFAKVTGDCSKFELELEFAGLVGGYERDFVNKKSTLAFGAGLSMDLANKDAFGNSQNSLIHELIPEIADAMGAGFGTKAQFYIETGPDGSLSDAGGRVEVSIEGPMTDQGDIKFGGKLGVNSGISVTPEFENVIGKINDVIYTSN